MASKHVRDIVVDRTFFQHHIPSEYWRRQQEVGLGYVGYDALTSTAYLIEYAHLKCNSFDLVLHQFESVCFMVR
jgi:hypothetical protein